MSIEQRAVQYVVLHPSGRAGGGSSPGPYRVRSSRQNTSKHPIYPNRETARGYFKWISVFGWTSWLLSGSQEENEQIRSAAQE